MSFDLFRRAVISKVFSKPTKEEIEEAERQAEKLIEEAKKRNLLLTGRSKRVLKAAATYIILLISGYWAPQYEFSRRYHVQEATLRVLSSELLASFGINLGKLIKGQRKDFIRRYSVKSKFTIVYGIEAEQFPLSTTGINNAKTFLEKLLKEKKYQNEG